MTILALTGSPSATSKSNRIVDQIGRRLATEGYAVESLAVRDLPAESLLKLDVNHPAIREALDKVAHARAIIIATPIYKASYSGLLKAFLDLLPQDGLIGKAVLPLASGGSLAHFLAIDYALRPVLAALDARHVLGGIFIQDSAITLQGDVVNVDAPTEERIEEGILRLVESLDGQESSRFPSTGQVSRRIATAV